ncbi:MAG: hypothetical protein JF597_31735 [Streptomyces sp.]|uniref:hypothetical protein n=1 Tax=Streptomyces sp. TaxID=1931 RepID=UPI0025D8E001|nr:hypothetical protein [Streptomyces sp.]MBW8797991.1 hypothetical protein [Streptomyces sp.]
MKAIASGLAVVGLLAGTACTAAEPPAASAPAASATTAERAAPAASPGASGASGTPALTIEQAQAALIDEGDLGVPWTATDGTATWHDGLLKAATGQADCQRLLEALYTDELLGAPAGPQARTALDDGDDAAQLRYQVDASRSADVERTLAWLRTLPRTCGQFTAQTTAAGTEAVQVTDAALPHDLGDARQGLRMTLTAQPTATDAPTTLTLDVAVVRVGDDAIVLTAGALGTLPDGTTEQALDIGVQRLAQVREKGRAQA